MFEDKYNAVMESFDFVSNYLMEPDLSPEELFSIISSFLQTLDSTVKKVSAKMERVEKMAKAKAAKEKKRLAKEAKKKKQPPTRSKTTT